jgi:L-cysteine desulfidase
MIGILSACFVIFNFGMKIAINNNNSKEDDIVNQKKIVELLANEVLPTMGCTEPGAVALAAACAGDALQAGRVTALQVAVNANVYKNGVAVGIPGTGETGLYIAAALGAVKKHPEKQLAVLSGVTDEELQQARELVAAGIIQVSVDESKDSLWVKVRLETENGWSEAIIKDKHTNVVSVVCNGNYILNRLEAGNQRVEDHRLVLRSNEIRVAELVKAIETIPVEELEFVLEGVDMNRLAAKAGIDKRLGMGIGAVYEEMMESGMLSDDIVNYAKMLTAAAADARMSGESIPVMSSAGSGNHGITVILPVYAVAEKLKVSRERLIRAVALSHLVTVYIKIYTGSLSALCGCAVAAATGASAAITWLMNGNQAQIEAAMKNIIANLTGMICDGGKVGCALKLSTAAAAAVESSLLAMRGVVVPDTNGIIADSVEQTVKNLGQVSNPGMLATDKIILGVMLEKQTLLQ